jgi:hypothetical protein
MTQREKTLVTGLVAAIGGIVGLGLLWVFALQPLTDANGRLETARSELSTEEGKLTKEQMQIGTILKVDPRLNSWKEISLSPRDPSLKPNQNVTEEQKKRHVQHVQVDYEKYLSEMMRNHRFTLASVQMAQVEKSAAVKGQKQPVFERVAFRVNGRGNLLSVTSFMEEFHKAPLLHQIRTATVELASTRSGSKAAEGELDLKMTIEALLVTGANSRPTLQPSKLSSPLRVLAEPARDYALMDKKNMFTGIKPPKKKDDTTPKVVTTPKEERRKEAREDVLRFIKLTMLCYDPDRDRWEGTVYDQAKGGSEQKLNTRVFSEYQVKDRHGYTTLDARLVYVDDKQAVFKEGKNYFRLKLGEFVYPAIRETMTSSELRALGISP